MTNDELELLCQERRSAAELRDLAEAEVKRLAGLIGDELNERGVERVELDGFVPRWVSQTRSTLDKIKLVEQGVPMAAIEAATVKSDVTYVRVDERKESQAGAGAGTKKKGKAA
jgi:hypothetical protein